MQGLGGAAVSAVALSLIMGLFTEPAERAKAMGVFGFVMSGGGALGVLLGGVLTGLLSWNWIFLVNVPIGVAVWLLVGPRCCRPTTSIAARQRLDVLGAVLVTGILMLAVYGVVGGNEAGWTSARPSACSASAVVAAWSPFVRPRGHASRTRWCRCGSSRCATSRSPRWSACCGPPRCSPASSSPALYLQQVLGYGALQVGLPTCRPAS